MSRQGGEKKSEGPGFLSSLLVAGGAAAVGFMAHKLMTDFQSQGQCEEARGGPTRGGEARGGPSAWSSECSPLGKRKENRSKEAKGDKAEDVETNVACVICMVNPREVYIIPCGHVCMCEECSERITTKCPMCNHRIEDKKPAYIS